MWELKHFRLYIYGKPIEFYTDHQALEPLIERTRSNKTYSARLTRWLDRLAQFDIQIKHFAGKHLRLTDYLSRKPIASPEPIEIYDEEYVILCLIPLLELVNNYGSITDERKTTKRTDQTSNSHYTNSQSETRHVQKLQTGDNKRNNCKSLLPVENSIRNPNYKNYHYKNKKIAIKTVEKIERENPSEETLKLTKRLKDIVEPGDYSFTQEQWKRYNPQER